MTEQPGSPEPAPSGPAVPAGEAVPAGRRRLDRTLRAVELVEGGVGALLLLAILVLIMIQVVVRFTEFGGWVWTGELARFSLVWLTFLLAAYLVGRDEHISLDVIDHILTRRGRRVVGVVANLVVAVICAGFVYEGVGLVEARSGVRSSAAEIPMSFVYAIPTIGFALTAVRALIGPFVRKGPA